MVLRAIVKQASIDRRKRFFIVTFGRTGSTTLMRMLNTDPRILCVREPFCKQHGVYRSKTVLTRSALDRHLRLLGLVSNGVKHLTCHLDETLNKHLISTPGCRIVLLWRRNLLQRVLSQFIAQERGVWHRTRAPLHEVTERCALLSQEHVANELEYLRKIMALYERFVAEKGILAHTAYFEDLFSRKRAYEERLGTFVAIRKFLGFDGEITPRQHARIRALMDPAGNEVTTKDMYRCIPNIDEIRAKFESEENGFLFENK